jgi:hypothetical protein
MRPSLRRSPAALVTVAVAFAIAAHADAAGLSREAREKAEVRAIFAMLLARMEPGDGWTPRDLPCVFSNVWADYIREGGEIVRPAPSLTPRQALDPKGKHPEQFCDYAARKAKAKDMAKALPDDHARIVTADMVFSYPIFSRNFTHAVLQHTGGNDSYLRDGQTDFVSSWRYVYLVKTRGRWTARFETMGIAN